MYTLVFTEKAKKDLFSLDKNIIRRIIKKLEFLVLQKNPQTFADHLTDMAPATHRFRIGDYRVIVSFDSARKEIIIYCLGHRREIYK